MSLGDDWLTKALKRKPHMKNNDSPAQFQEIVRLMAGFY